MKANTKFKSSVFSLLFSDPEVLRELYCALKGLSLPDDVPVVINTLEDVLFMDQLNDISFEIGGRLVVLIEHQSTINPNMALRLLMYIGRIYEKIVEDKNIYSKKQIYIPQPEFFVLYNGIDPFPDECNFKLSELFMDIEPLGLPEKAIPVLELEVKVLNINEGKNEAIVKKCRFLSQYSAFTAKVRELKNGGYSLQEAIKRAVVYCRSHDILKEFLEKQASEVLSMLMTEWNMDDALAVRYEEGLEDGEQKGIQIGEKKGELKNKKYVLDLIDQGLSIEELKQRLENSK
ncbi:MAG: Rpn family recombination-promoting nuclease/putative transposase [Treponema sp.]|nr:Rpn family recombination-promoting nuclease/putative transposase [Treponema sp.]